MTTIPIERICAIAALTLIALVGMWKLPDGAENLSLNVVVAIAAFISGAVVGKKP